MVRNSNATLESTWRERLARQAESGQSVAEFCRAQQTTEAMYYYWRRRLQARPSGATTPAQRARSRKRKRVSGSAQQVSAAKNPRGSFLPLWPAPRSGAWIELSLLDGTVIRIPRDQLSALELILTTLRQSPLAPVFQEPRDA